MVKINRDSDISGQTVVVTGAAGFIGSHLVDKLLNLGCKVLGVDDFSNGDIKNIQQAEKNKNFKLFQGSVDDAKFIHSIFDSNKIDVVFHLSALNLIRSVENPIRDLEVNAKGTLVLLEKIKEYDIILINSSTGSVYGTPLSTPQKETHPLNPTSPYGVSKLAAEKYVGAYSHMYGLSTISLRYYNVYGPRQNYGEGGGVIPLFIMNALKGKTIYVEGDGNQERCFTFVDDVVRANILAAFTAKEYGRVYNVATEESITINKLVSIINEIHSINKIISAPPRVGDIRVFNPDISLIKKELSYVPETVFAEGLLKTYDFLSQELRETIKK